MSHGLESAAALRVVEAIRSAFPEDASAVDARMTREGFETAEAPHIWVEYFSQKTTDALKGDASGTAEAHLRLLSQLLDTGDEATKRCIDVSYVESLMWDIKDENRKRAGWQLVPDNLRRLYVAMWGQQPFMRGES